MDTMYDLFEKHKQTHDQMEWELRRAYTYAEYVIKALANDAIVPADIRQALRLDILNMTYLEGPLHKWVLRDIISEYAIPPGKIHVDKAGELHIPSRRDRDAETERLFTDTVLALAKHYTPRPEPSTKEQVIETPCKQLDGKHSVSEEQVLQAVNKFNAYTGLPEKPERITFDDLILRDSWDSIFMDRKPLFMNMRLAWNPGNCDNYMTSELRAKYLAKEPVHIWELASLFTTDERGQTLRITNSGMVRFPDASIVNMLVFGKTNISREMVPTVLSLIRFGHSPSSRTQLDNYVIDRSDHRYVSDPITWRDDNMHELAFPLTDTQRMEAAKGLIHLMNETDPKELNMVNYYHIGAWIYTYKKQVEAVAKLQIADTLLHRGEQLNLITNG
jgi:hypothetical protein